MEAFDSPALVSQSELVVERAVVQGPGEVPRRFAVLTRKGTLADEPAEGPGGVAMCAVHAQPNSLSLAPLLLGIEDGDRSPLLVGDACGQVLRRVQRGYLSGMRTRARATPTTGLGQWSGCSLGDLRR